MDPSVLYEDKDIIVAFKPAGMLSQSDRGSDMDMVSFLKNHLGEREPYIGLINRLDRPVSGIMVFGRNEKATASLNRQVSGQGNEPRMEKIYRAVLTGVLKDDEGTLCDYLLKDQRSNTSSIVKKGTPKAKEALLSYRTVKTGSYDGKQYSLVDIKLLTGRHHQIRLQMAGQGAGILGDMKYNGEACKDYRGELKLMARRLVLCHPRTKKKMEFEINCDFDI